MRQNEVHCDICDRNITDGGCQHIILGRSRNFDLCTVCYNEIEDKIIKLQEYIESKKEKKIMKEDTWLMKDEKFDGDTMCTISVNDGGKQSDRTKFLVENFTSGEMLEAATYLNQTKMDYVKSGKEDEFNNIERAKYSRSFKVIKEDK